MPSKRRASPQQRADAAKRQQAELKDLHGRLADNVERLTHSEGWREWLDVAARFRSYSLNNQLLIMAQKPGATLVAGYTDWQKMGRQVRKGEGGPNAIRILAPVKRRVPATDTDPTTADGGEAEAAERGNATQVRTVGFKPTSVFDVTQTDGDPLPERPEPQLLQGRAPDGLWESLEAFGTERGFDIGREHLTDGSNGYTDHTARIIRVRDDVEPAQAVRTLAHEIGHALLHDDGHAHRGIAEVEAESLAHLVLAAHGADTDAYTFDYVTGWATQVPGQEPADTVRATADRVLTASRTVLGHTLDTATDSEQLRDQRDQAARGVETTSALADRAELRAGTAVDTAADERAAGRASTASWVSNEPELAAVPAQLQRQAAANTAAAQFYGDQLHATPHAHDYATRRVGDLEQLPDEVQVGYAPPGWTSLLDHLRHHGHDDRDLLEAGLVQHTRHGNLIDRFRDRVTVAIHDQDGRVAGFIGRPPHEDFDPERTPKYLNTQSSALFDKGKVVFGAHEQRDALAHGATPVLAEGPFDALALAGADNGQQRIAAIATCGTAVTPHHLLTVHHAATSEQLVLALDGDAAGQAAGARAADLALDLPRDVSAVTLPDGHDPASWLAAHPDDRDAALRPFLDRQRQAPAAQVVLDARIEQYFAAHPPQHRHEVEGQVGALHAAVPVLTRLDATTAAQHGIRVASQLQLDAGTVASAIADGHTADGEATKRVHDRATVAAGVTSLTPHRGTQPTPGSGRGTHEAAARAPRTAPSATRPHSPEQGR